MKQNIFKRIGGFLLALALLVGLLPGILPPVRAATPAWTHMSDVEAAAGMASYDAATGKMTLKNDAGWSARMQYTGIADASGKDWTIEFDMVTAGGAIGVYQYDASGAMYGAYLDTNASALDSVRFDDWTTSKDGFYFYEGKTAEAAAPNWKATDKTSSHIRVDFVRGAGGTMAGGTVTYYKKNLTTGQYAKLGTLIVSSELKDDAAAPNMFGIHLVLGEATISNVTFADYKPINWIHMNDTEMNNNLAIYDPNLGQITFKNNPGWANRMQYIGLNDAAGKDWTIEFDMSVDGGAFGIYQYEASGALYGAYLDTNAAKLDAVQFSNWTTQQDGFYFYGDPNPPVNANNWTPITDRPASHIRADFIRGPGGTMAGGKVIYYKRIAENQYVEIGKLDVPTNLIDNADQPNFFGMHLVLGNGKVSNISITEFTAAPEVPKNPDWTYMSPDEKNMGKVSYDPVKDELSFLVNDGWAARMQYVGLNDIAGKDWTIEFGLSVDGGAIGVYQYDATGALYGAYLDTNASAVDSVRFSNWTTCQDGFYFYEGKPAEGGVLNWDPNTDKPASQIRVDFVRGEGGTMAGGTVTYYKKNGAGKYVKLGTLNVPENIADSPTSPNYFGIHLVLGNGKVTNPTIKEYVPLPAEEPMSTKWLYVSNYEQNQAKASYNEPKDTLTFRQDDGWNARMLYNGSALPNSKDIAIEFDMNITGGAIGAFAYEPGGMMYGVFLDTGAGTLDAVRFTKGDTCLDDFYFRESTTKGATTHTIVPVENWGSSYLKNTRIRVELSGDTITYYRKDAKKDLYYRLGSVKLPSDLKKEHADQPLGLGVQLWLGEGTISNFTIGARKNINVYKDPTWVHLSEYEQKKGEAKYNASTGTITFSGKCEEWNSRMINTEIKDLSGKSFAVEFHANLGTKGAIGITPFYDDAEHFYSVYYDIAGSMLDGVGLNGKDSKGKLVVLDDFAYINDKIYPHFPMLAKSPSGGQGVTFRVECFLGKNGTMAGGKVHFYFKKDGFTQWTRMGVITMPTTIQDNPDMPNRLMIHSRLANGNVSNIKVTTGIKEPVLPYAATESKIWGYVSDHEKLIGAASFDDATGVMTMANDSGWASRMIYLPVADVSGKAFAMEFNAAWGVGGALGVVPFYEDANNFYGIFLDRGARTLDGAGYSGGKIIDEFNYIDASLYSSVTPQTYPVITTVHYRYEFFPGPDGTAAGGTCKLFYKTMTEGEVRDENWRLIGEFTLPDTLVDSPDKANRIMIAARLMSATLSDISYTEISPDLVTYYDNGPEDFGFEDGYPVDDYVPVPVEEKPFAPWWSIAMVAAGGIALIALAVAMILKKKKVK